MEELLWWDQARLGDWLGDPMRFMYWDRADEREDRAPETTVSFIKLA